MKIETNEKTEINKTKEQVIEETEKNEENKKNCSFLVNYISNEFKSLSISTQFLFLYFFIMVNFVILLSVTKVLDINNILNEQSNYYFYKAAIKNYTLVQQMLSLELRHKITYSYQQNILSNLFVYEIYSKELISNGLLNQNTNIDTDKNDKLFDSISNNNLNYKLNWKITEKTNNKINQLVTPNYLITPLLAQSANFSGLEIVNMYIVANVLNEICDNNSLFFKYPYEKSEDISNLQSNSNEFDSIIDPITYCSSSNFTNFTNNWFNIWNSSITNKSIQHDFKVLSLLRERDNYTNDEYFMVSMFNQMNNPIDGKNYNVFFALKFKREYTNIIVNDKNYVPFNNNKTNWTDITYLNINNQQGISNINESLLNKYSIDEKSTIVLSNKNQLNNLFMYGMLNPNSNETGFDVNSVFIKTDLIINSSNYTQNFFYINDNLFFNWSLFANVYFNSAINYSSPDYSIISYPNNTNNFNCFHKNLTVYYQNLHSTLKNYFNDVPYNCLDDVCHFVDCSNLLNPNLTNYNRVFDYTNQFPNCLCMPMFCYDKINTNTVPDEFKNFLYESINLDKECAFNFTKMSYNNNNYSQYIVSVHTSPLLFNNQSSSISIYLIDQSQQRNIFSLDKIWNDYVKLVVFCIYFIFLFIILIIFVKITVVKFSVFQKRIDDSYGIIEDIIMVKENRITSEKEEVEILKEEQNNLIDGNKEEEFGKLEDEKQEEKIVISTVKEKTKNPKDEILVKKEIKVEEVEKFEDELEEITTMIRNNKNEFKIDFDSQGNIFAEDKTIKQFKVEVNKMKYLLNVTTEDNKKAILKGNDESFAENKFENQIDSTVYIISELLSTEMIIFDQISQNFSYVEKGKPPNNKNKFSDIIDKYLYDEQVRVNEIIVEKVIESLTNYFYDEINDKWIVRIVKI